MKSLLENRFLCVALAISLVVHGVVLFMQFAVPALNKTSSRDEGLEVILVNAKHDKSPVKAEVLAQANLDGGGQADEGRATSPLPNMGHISNGSASAKNQQVAELEAMQRQIMNELQKQAVVTTSNAAHKVQAQAANTPSRSAKTPAEEELAAEIARMEAEIAKNIQAYNKRPKKTQVTPSAKEVGYALYYKKMQEKIEYLGTRYFPESQGKKLYGELLVSIPVFQDGTIYRADGGVKVEQSSGNARLDRAAVAIVERAAPFDHLPKNMLTTGKDDVWEIITRFRFTRDEVFSAEMRGN